MKNDFVKSSMSCSPSSTHVVNGIMAPLDEGPRPKSGKSWLNLHGIILNEKSIGWNQKIELKKRRKRAYDLENQDAS